MSQHVYRNHNFSDEQLDRQCTVRTALEIKHPPVLHHTKQIIISSREMFALCLVIVISDSEDKPTLQIRNDSFQQGKGSPYAIAERRVPELIPVLCSQPAGDVSYKPGGKVK